MRVTTQMFSNAALKSGISNQSSLLNMLNGKSSLSNSTNKLNSSTSNVSVKKIIIQS